MQAFLKSIPLFSNLSDEDLSRLVEIVAEVRLSKGVYLFEEGSIGRYFFVIKEGEIEIFTRSGQEELLLAVRKPGEFIGELSLLDKNPRMASARSRTDTLLLLIPKKEFERLLETNPQVTRNILYTVLPRWRDTEIILREREHQVYAQSVELEQMLEHLKKANDELEQRVMERTSELEKANDLLAKRIEAFEQAENHGMSDKIPSAAEHTQSFPMFPIAERVLFLPVIGSLEEPHQSPLISLLTQQCVQHTPDILILDLSSALTTENQSVNRLIQTLAETSLGAQEIVLTGIQPHVNEHLLLATGQSARIITFATLPEGIAYALDQEKR